MAYDDTLFQLGMDLTRSSTAHEEDHRDTALVALTSNTALRHEPELSPDPGLETHSRHSDAVVEKLSPEEDHSEREPEERLDFFIEKDGVRYAGNHLIVDLFGASKLDDVDHMERAMRRCVEEAGATMLNIDLHHFTPNGGVSGVAVLSESHISVHTWPEADYGAFDVFMCGDAKPHLCVDILKEEFGARDVVVKTHRRGEELDLMAWKAGADKQARAA